MLGCFRKTLQKICLLALALILTLGCTLPSGGVTVHAAEVLSGAHSHAASSIVAPPSGGLGAPVVAPQMGGTAKIPVSVIISTGKLIGKNAFLGYKLLRGATAGGDSWKRGGSITDVAADAISGFTGIRVSNVDTREMYVEIQNQFQEVHKELGDLAASIKEVNEAIADLKSDLERYAAQITLNNFQRDYAVTYEALNKEYLDLAVVLKNPSGNHEAAYKELYAAALDLYNVVYPYLSGTGLWGDESILDVIYLYATHTESTEGAVESANALAQEIYGAYVFAEYCKMTCELYQANFCLENDLDEYAYASDKTTPLERYGAMMAEASVRQVEINNLVCSFITEVNLDNAYLYNPQGSNLYINYPATVMQACQGDHLYFHSMPELFDGIFNPDGFSFRVSDSSLASVTQSGVVEVLGANGSFTVSLFYRAAEGATEVELYRLTVNIKTRAFSGGFGTADAPYVISTAEDFKNIIENYVRYKDQSPVFALYNDINMGGVELEPLDMYEFTGTLNGNGFAVYNFQMSDAFFNEAHLGIFSVNGGTICDLRIGKSGFSDPSYKKSVYIGINGDRTPWDTADTYVGVLCGKNNGTIRNCVIENVLVSRELTEQDDNRTNCLNVGALAGINYGTIERCTVRNTEVCSVLKAYDKSGDINVACAGGLLGVMAGGSISESIVIDCTLTATAHGSGSKTLFIKNNAEAHAIAGGLFGKLSNGTIKRCVAFNTTVSTNAICDNEHCSKTTKNGGIAGSGEGGSGSNNYAVNTSDTIYGSGYPSIGGAWARNPSPYFVKDFPFDQVIYLDANTRPQINYLSALTLSYATVKTQYKKNEAFNPVGLYAVTVDALGNLSTQTVPFVRVDASRFGASGGEIKVSSWGGLANRFTATRTCDHTWGNGTVTVESTHTTNGTKVYTCSECGQTQTETLATIAHTYDKQVKNATYLVSEATCLSPALYYFSCSCGAAGKETFADTEAGLGAHDLTHYPAEAADCTKDVTAEHYVCNTCDRIFRDAEATDEVADPDDLIVHGSGHAYISKDIAPTCTENGYTLHICSKCGNQYRDNYLFADGHDEVVDAAVAATCTQSGLTAGRHCSTCGEVLVAQNVIPAKGHTEVIQAGKAATCTEKGLTEGRYCSTCQTVFATQTEIPAKGHTSVTDPARAATCTVVGLTEGSHCSSCSLVFVAQTEIPATGHTEANDAAVEPTCTQNGLTAGKHCVTCGAVTQKQNPIPALGHVETVDAAVPATCTQSGLSQGKHCTVCLAVTLAQTTVPATGHTELIFSAVAPTCTQSGLTEGRRCNVCGITTLQQTPVPATGHVEIVDAAVAPTCTQTGLTEGKHCGVCAQVFVPQVTLPAKGHGELSDWAVAIEPKPGVAGEEQRCCNDCGEVMETRPIDALPIETETSTQTGTGADTPASGGCSGMLGGNSALAVIFMLLGAAFVLQPKKRTE